MNIVNPPNYKLQWIKCTNSHPLPKDWKFGQQYMVAYRYQGITKVDVDCIAERNPGCKSGHCWKKYRHRAVIAWAECPPPPMLDNEPEPADWCEQFATPDTSFTRVGRDALQELRSLLQMHRPGPDPENYRGLPPRSATFFDISQVNHMSNQPPTYQEPLTELPMSSTVPDIKRYAHLFPGEKVNLHEKKDKNE